MNEDQRRSVELSFSTVFKCCQLFACRRWIQMVMNYHFRRKWKCNGKPSVGYGRRLRTSCRFALFLNSLWQIAAWFLIEPYCIEQQRRQWEYTSYDSSVPRCPIGGWIANVSVFRRLYTQGDVIYGSVRNVAETSNLPVSNTKKNMHWKTSSTKSFLATRKFQKREVLHYRKEMWWIELAYVDKLEETKNGVQFSLLRQDVLVRSVYSKGRKTTESKEMQFKPKKTDKTKFAFTLVWKMRERFKNFEMLQERKFTVSKIKIAFAEGATWSLKSFSFY